MTRNTCPFKKGDRVRHAYIEEYDGRIEEIESDDWLGEPYWLITVRNDAGSLHRHLLTEVWVRDLSADKACDTRPGESS